LGSENTAAHSGWETGWVTTDHLDDQPRPVAPIPNNAVNGSSGSSGVKMNLLFSQALNVIVMEVYPDRRR